MHSFSQVAFTAARSAHRQRWMHSTSVRCAITNFLMPAMSPTMTEGGIASWKFKEGDAFEAGDVLLEIETDKATIDVEAQDAGILGKILAPDGTKNIPVNKPIALLAEEGDDISNLQAPPESSAPPPPAPAAAAPAPSPAPSSPAPPPPPKPSGPQVHPEHSRPLFPSVLRLLQENGIADADKISGTGVRGMLTKGDVLTYLGKASGPLGTFKEPPAAERADAPKKKEEPVVLDGPALRRLIVNNMLDASVKARAAAAPSEPASFDSIIADYLPHEAAPAPVPTPRSAKATKSTDYLDGLV